jgi:hypothetical protein
MTLDDIRWAGKRRRLPQEGTYGMTGNSGVPSDISNPIVNSPYDKVVNSARGRERATMGSQPVRGHHSPGRSGPVSAERASRRAATCVAVGVGDQ